MEIAERFGFPVVSLVDTPGAYPGVAAEQHGQGGAIARSQARDGAADGPDRRLRDRRGRLGRRVAIAVADRVLMQENAIYSVITPEGCAAILWRDAGEAKKAAAAFKPDALHCLELGVIDGIVPEPDGGAQLDHDAAARAAQVGARRGARRARGHPGRGAAPPPAREVPRHGRLRLSIPAFPHSPQGFQPGKSQPWNRAEARCQSGPRTPNPRQVKKRPVDICPPWRMLKHAAAC